MSANATDAGRQRHTGRYLVSVLVLALAYAACALFANALLPHVGHALPVSPSAGVAVAVLLFRGRGLWPGVAAGHLLFDVVAGGHGSGGLVALGTGAVLAVGPSLQAVVAALLARSHCRALVEGDAASLFRAMLLAGPVACLVAPTLGVGLLLGLGLLPADAAMSSWIVWWVGDSLGVLLFGPLAALCLSRVRHAWRGRLLLIVPPLLGASAVLVAGISWFHHNEESKRRQEMDARLGLAREVLRERELAAVDAVVASANLFTASRFVTRAEFAAFASGLRRPGLSSLQWMTPVAGEQGGAIETLDVRYRFPEADGPPAGRVDLRDDPVAREVVFRALATGRAAASAPRVSATTGSTRVWVVVPVFDGQGAGVEGGDAGPRLSGTVVGILEADLLGRMGAVPLDGTPLEFRLVDATPVGHAAPVDDADRRALDPGDDTLVQELSFFGRLWRLQAHLPDDYWLPGASVASRLFLLGALLGAFLFSVYVLSNASRHRAIMLEVQRRTREVNDARRKLETAMDVAGIAGWELDLTHREFIFDERCFALLGTTAEAQGGFRQPADAWVEAFVHPEDAPLCLDALRVTSIPGAGAPSRDLEFRIVRDDGLERVLQVRFEVDRDERGHAVRALGVSQDVSERKAKEEALRESEEYSRSIVESSDDCIKVLDLGGRLLQMADKGRAIMGVADFESIRGADWRSFWQRAEDRAAVEAALDSARAGDTGRFQGHTPTMDGTPKWWDVVVSPILDAAGRPVRLLAVSRDVTEDHATRAALERLNADLELEVERRSRALADSERQLRAIFDAAAVGIVHVVDGELLRANPKFWEIVGYDPQDRASLSRAMVVHPDDLAEDLALIERLSRGEIDSYVQEKRYLRKDGAVVWVRVTGSAVHDDEGRLLYRVAVIEDIDQARRSEQLRLASEKRYRDLFERNPMPMWTHDRERGAITAVNAAALRRYGYSRDEFLALSLSEIGPTTGAHVVDPPASGDTPATAVEVRHRTRDGSCITVEVSSYDFEEDGRPLRLVLARDVSDRRRADDRLAGQQHVLEAIASGGPLGDSLAMLVRLVEADASGVIGAILPLDGVDTPVRGEAAPNLPPDLQQALENQLASLSEDSLAAMLLEGGSLAIPEPGDAPADREAFFELARSHGVRGLASEAIVNPQGGLLGVFVMLCKEPRDLGASERQLLSTLTQTAAIAIVKEAEKRALEESEVRFRTIFESSPTGIVLVNREGDILAANSRQCEITRLTREQLIGTNVLEHTHPDDRVRDAAQLERVWSGGMATYSVEKRGIRADGSEYWVGISGSVVRDDAGEAQYGIRVVDDITARKSAEAQLYRQEEMNRLLLENLSEGVVACNAEGELSLFNRMARDWLGADTSTAPAGEWSEMFGLFEGDGATPMAADRIPLVRALRGEPVRAAEMSIVRDGEPPRFVLASGAPLCDASGNKLGAVVVMHDVTERRRADRMAREALTTLDETHDGTFIFDPQSLRFTYVNEGAVRQVGYSREALLAMTPMDIAPEFTERAFRRFISPMLNGRTSVLHFTTLHRHQSGHDIPVEIKLQYLAPAGETPRFIAVVRDVTERQHALRELERAASDLREANAAIERERETLERRVAERTQELTEANGELERARDAAEAASHAKSTFLATISHEIRTPMNGVLGAMELLEAEELAPGPAKLLGTAQGSARSLLGLLNDLLDMAKIEAGRIEILPAVSSLESIVGQVLSTHLPNALTRGIHLTSDLSPSAPRWVVADALRLRQVLGNLVSNAVKFTPRGGVAICVEAQALGGGVHRVRFVVRDTGVGIPAEVLKRLFRPFEQGTLERARESGGSGLGLAICRGLAERMGGRVLLVSEPGAGTTATLELELMQAEAPAAGHRLDGDQDEQAIRAFARGRDAASTANAQVLVADDHPVNRDLLVLQLSNLGVRAASAMDGAQALEMLRDGDYALVITDCEMPNMDGYELCRKIRAGASRSPSLPVIACTAHALPEVARRCRNAGMDEVLTKPTRLAELARTLQRYLPAVTPEIPAVPDATPGAAMVLDRAQLEQVSAGDPLVERELLQSYADDNRVSLQELERAVSDGDHDGVRRLAHRSKGACLLVGAAALAEALAGLEQTAGAGGPPEQLQLAMCTVLEQNAALETVLEQVQAEAV